MSFRISLYHHWGKIEAKDNFFCSYFENRNSANTRACEKEGKSCRRGHEGGLRWARRGSLEHFIYKHTQSIAKLQMQAHMDDKYKRNKHKQEEDEGVCELKRKLAPWADVCRQYKKDQRKTNPKWKYGCKRYIEKKISCFLNGNVGLWVGLSACLSPALDWYVGMGL